MKPFERTEYAISFSFLHAGQIIALPPENLVSTSTAITVPSTCVLVVADDETLPFERNFFGLNRIFNYAFRLVALRRSLMVEVAEITLEKVRQFTGRSCTLVTIDAPLFGSIMIFNGRILAKGSSYVDPKKIGKSVGFPPYEQVVAEASRFWIVDDMGVRRVKCREEMAKLIESSDPRISRIPQMKSAKFV
jgi:hypothetical protein